MRCINKIRLILISMVMILCSCLTGCSLSFCGLGAPKEEFVFYCDEGLTAEEKLSEEPKEKLTPKTEDKETEEIRVQENDAQEEDIDTRININTADVEELMTLKGVGESRAQAIIAWRTEKGPFEKPEDIMQISGIKEGVYSRIKDQIRVR